MHLFYSAPKEKDKISKFNVITCLIKVIKLANTGKSKLEHIINQTD